MKSAVIVLGALLTTAYLLFTSFTFAFNPPTGAGGSGGGAIGVDGANNLAIGTSTSGLDSKVLIYATSTNTFILKVVSTTSSPILVVKRDGRVGIATSTPTSTLTVQGDLTVTGIIYGIFNGQLSGSVSAANVSGDVFGRICCGVGNYSFPSSLGVATSTTVGLPQQLSVYGNAYMSGNVGIGTANPGFKLDVAGDIQLSGNIFSPSDDVAFLTDALEALPIRTGGILVGGNYDAIPLNGEIITGVFGDVGDIILKPRNIEAMRITAGRNVGIGTSSPAYRLDVGTGDLNVQSGVYRQGGTKAGITRTCAAGETIASTTVSGGIITLGSCVSIGSGLTGGIASKVAFWTSATTLSATSTFHWDNTNGRLGIGTTAPGSLLHIQSADPDYTALRITNTLSTPGIWELRSVQEGTGIYGPNDGFAVWGGPQGSEATRMVIDKYGNVGIGTLAPQRQFQIDSDVSGVGFDGLTSSPNAGFFRFGDNSGWKLNFGRSRETPGGAINIGTTGTLLTIQDNGNVGIGTSSPAYKLDVVGDIRATGNMGVGSIRPGSKLTVEEGDVFVTSSSRGIILKAPDAHCARVQLTNSNTLTVTTITCP